MANSAEGTSYENGYHSQFLDSFQRSYSINEEDEHCNRTNRSIIIFNCTLVAFGFSSAIILIVILFSKRNLRLIHYNFLNFLIASFILRLFLNGIVYTEEAFDLCWRIGRPICLLLKLAEPVITYSVVVFLIVVAWEQCCRYGRSRERGVNAVSSKGLHVFMLYCLVFLLSTPDIINSLSEQYNPNYPIEYCDINHNHPSPNMYIVLSSKGCFLEYILPLAVLYTFLVVIVIRMIKSRVNVSAPQTTACANYRPPRYFAMLVATVVAYTIGYFPRYAYMLIHLIIRIFSMDVKDSVFLYHLHIVDRIFALIPPSFFPLFVLTLSRQHLEAGKEILYRIKVRLSGRGWRSGSMMDANGEEEALNIGMDQLGNHSQS